MGTPTNRTPLRVARGTTSALNTGLSDIQEGEIVWDTTLNRLQVKEGSALESSTAASDATKAPLASPTFTGTVTIPSGASISGFAPLAGPTFTGSPTVPGYMPLAGGTFTGDLQIDNAKKFILSETDANGTHYLSFKAPDSVTATVDFTLPDGDGSANQVLKTNGSAVLSWTTPGDAVLATDQTWGGAQRGAITALTDGATIAIDFNSSNNFSVTLAGNRTLGQPSNQVAGQSGSIFVTQDGTGSRTLAFHADWDFPGGTAPTLTTTAAAVDRIDYIVAAANKVHAVASLDVK